jgi:hypothetical protein
MGESTAILLGSNILWCPIVKRAMVGISFILVCYTNIILKQTGDKNNEFEISYYRGDCFCSNLDDTLYT